MLSETSLLSASLLLFRGEFKKVKNKELLKKFLSVLAQRTNKDNANTSSITRFALRSKKCMIGQHIYRDRFLLHLVFRMISWQQKVLLNFVLSKDCSEVFFMIVDFILIYAAVLVTYVNLHYVNETKLCHLLLEPLKE